MESVGGWAVILIGVAIYLLPALNASSRGHHSSGAIWVLNIFLGWTLLGWVAALVWSATKPQHAPTASVVQPTAIKPISEAMKKCPACAEMIKAEAIKCRFCGESQTAPTHYVARQPKENPPTGTMGYCPECMRVRGTNTSICVYCGNTEKVPVAVTQRDQ